MGDNDKMKIPFVSFEKMHNEIKDEVLAKMQEIYEKNIAVEKDPWIIRDTAFIKMILEHRFEVLNGLL